jgi:hypothetical protein
MRETTAAMRPSAAETAKTRTRPSWNGPEMRPGKNSRPVSRLLFAGVSDDSAPYRDSRCCTGFTPSMAANREETGPARKNPAPAGRGECR